MKTKEIIISAMMFLAATVVQAQRISIGGNVYGGGNAGDMTGNTSVTVRSGDLHEVYGGARVADVGGSTFVNIDGKNASDYIVIDRVYGGNDIAGTIGTIEATKVVPLDKLTHENDLTNDSNKINNSWDAVVLVSSKTVVAHNKPIYIGQLFGGGNGEYEYSSVTTEASDETPAFTTHTIKDKKTGAEILSKKTAVGDVGFSVPNLAKAYLEIMGGSIVYAYGGGNNATVTNNTVICVDNPSDVVGSIKVDKTTGDLLANNATGDNVKELLDEARFERMGVYGVPEGFTHASSVEFQIGRLFGGNNKAEMDIMPNWNLQSGKVRNLYSGGNEGDMIFKRGILLEIKAGSTIMVDNVFGGCRKADVNPKDKGVELQRVYGLDGYHFPDDLAARVLLRGGNVNNVYGGNDISGKVRFGSALGVYADVRGNVYGGGNGSYAYTDNPDLKDDPVWGDYYYDVKSLLGAEASGWSFESTPSEDNMKLSVKALNLFRPNAEQVSIRVAGTSEENPTIIGGSVFVGGNSATLKPAKVSERTQDYQKLTGYPLAQMKIGSYMIVDKLFLGNNGENMVDASANGILARYVGTVKNSANEDKDLSTLDLTDADLFAEYMEGVVLEHEPSVTFDSKIRDGYPDYLDYTASIGSFYCGGNVGSMRSENNLSNIIFDHKVIIFDKLVGGCNNANVPEQWTGASNTSTKLNAAYQGGLLGDPDANGNKLILNLSGLKIQPKRWAVQRNADYTRKLTDGKETYLLTDGTNYDLTESAPGRHRYLEWNTVDSRTYNTTTKTYNEVAPEAPGTVSKNSDENDLNRRLYGGNVYGGCYNSGIVNGNVVINLNASIVDRDILFDKVESNELGEEESLYGTSQTGETNYKITQRRTGVILGQQGMDVFGSALNVFGGGKGKDTEIWGSTTINLNEGYTFQVFGGSEEGVIGKPETTTVNGKETFVKTTANDYVYNTETGAYAFNGKVYKYNSDYSCYVNLCGTVPGVSKAQSKEENNDDILAECEFMYGGGFFGPICGNTIINMGDGRIFNSFAGSCNADILGHTETYIGRQVKDGPENNKYQFKNVFATHVDDASYYRSGFPWVRDITYGANDLGGRIFKEKDFTSRVRTASDVNGFDVIGKVHKDVDGNRDVLTASAYTEYLQGRADAIFGGCYGTYDYSDHKFERYTYTAIRNNNGEITGYPNDGSNASNLGEPKMNGSDPLFYKPRLDNAFVNFRPTYYSDNNVVGRVFGAGQGQSGEKERDLLQNRSYVLIDIPEAGDESEQNFNKYSTMEVFGAGCWGGVGMNGSIQPKEKPADTATDEVKATYKQYLKDLDKHSAIIDLVRGDIGAAYGASYEEGVTRRTLVNVPTGSTIKIGSIFGGGFGNDIYLPCDAYEANVEYHSKDAWLKYNPLRTDKNGVVEGNELMKGAIYGGNNHARRTLYATINIDVKVQQDSWKYGSTTGNVYGAGYGGNTWAEYTLVNLKRGAEVFEAYGGGEAGKVFNTESVHDYMTKKEDNAYYYKPATWPAGSARAGEAFTDDDWAAAWKIGGGLDPTGTTPYWNNKWTNLANPLVRVAEMDDREFPGITTADRALVEKRYTANVIINEGAYVHNYVYGGGYGQEAVVSGTTYVALLGGEVNKDIYAAGTSGDVEDLYGVGQYSSSNQGGFTVSTNVYVKGGTCRNVYGGGWRGDVGHHRGHLPTSDEDTYDPNSLEGDIPGEAHVVIGDKDGSSHLSGIPSITRNVYGGGEGGAIFGDAYVTLNKGYIGYRYNGEANDLSSTVLDDRYVPELDDAKPGDNHLDKGGNVFGGGYVANSYVDYTHVEMWDGIVRGGLYGGGEIGPVGRGTVHKDTLDLASVAGYIKHNYGGDYKKAAIYKGGETHVVMWGGHVMRDVFGGGRGYDNWNGEGWFQSEEEKQNMDRSSKGYVFGTTDVRIRGGEIGTEEGILQGYGNVFGGGNEGFVYSPTGVKTGEQVSDDQLVNGVPTGGGGFYYKNGDTSQGLTLDCNVSIEPYCKVKPGCVIDGFTPDEEGKVKASYSEGEYVPVEALNQLLNRNKDNEGSKKWQKLDTSGITIHNALFAGGNITEGSDNLYANTVTVYGNAAASIRDVYNHDLISLGTDDMGGLYGDGNLTLVDGFRELHIDNYGTDYYSLAETMELTDYENNLTPRQQAYYKLKYVTSSDHTFYYWECQELHNYEIKDENEVVISSTPYKRGQKIDEETYNAFSDDEKAYWQKGQKTYQDKDQIEEGEYILMYADEQANWTKFGVTSIYAGRPLNTIQRADMCGVFGSRMVLKGAEDRVIDAVDYHLYTINRVDEVSLNKRVSTAGDTDEKDKEHGNYFGIYNEVNYLGNLTSDVFFDDVRKTNSTNSDNKKTIEYPKDSGTEYEYGEASYYQWKASMPNGKNRNNGISHNMVALASGVHLELKRQEGELTGVDDWGYITGVVELDLINVMPGMGGGYVYARNEHGKKTWHGDPTITSTTTEIPAGRGVYWNKVTLLDENISACTYRRFEYTKKNVVADLQPIETSGNFIHNTKQIVDDCYPNGGIYNDGYTKSPAHYWFIRGSIYVYDQYISAYTGAANAYAEKVELPLTISAAANGRMTLREVQPNFYAYYDKNGNKLGDNSANADETIIINNNTYYLNDPVSYWEYRLMSDAEKARFVEETYVVIDTCTVDGVEHLKGEVLLPSQYSSLKTSNNGVHVVTFEEGGVTKTDPEKGFDYFFRSSNNLSTNTGYVLTYDVNNPMVWNNYYTKKTDPAEDNKLNTDDYTAKIKNNQINKIDYIEGPTYTLKTGATSSVYGQEKLNTGAIVFKKTKDKYDAEVFGNVTYTAIESGTTLTKGKTYYTKSGNTYTPFSATGDEVVTADLYYTNGQAIVEKEAYVVTKEYSVKNADGTEKQHLNVGTPIYESNYTSTQWTDIVTTTKSAEKAKVCTSLLEFSATDYVYAGKLLTADDITTLTTKVIAKMKYTDDGNDVPVAERKTKEQKAADYLADYIDDAYYCTEGGNYGGTYFVAGQAYSAIDTWCSITAEERNNFDFNYDALDLLVDPTYSNRDEGRYGNKPQYDGSLETKIYSVEQPIDYLAECTSDMTYYKLGETTQTTIAANSSESAWLSRTAYEEIPNEKRHYSPINVTKPGDYYVVNTACLDGNIPYTVGQVIDKAAYESMNAINKKCVDIYNFVGEQAGVIKTDEHGDPVTDENGDPVYTIVTHYYCREDYEVYEKGGVDPNSVPSVTTEGVSVKKNSSETTTTLTSATYDKEDIVHKGDIISQDTYNNNVPNFQTGFRIHGTSPTETSTLYVSNESDIHDLSKEKIITVIYLYEYEESDEEGMNVVPVSERHIVNIHINFKSGVPEIGSISKPDIVLPGTTIGMNIPTVSQGAYRVTESGWEIFDNENDAKTHTNGHEYINNTTPVYWYQNHYWIAYYAQTYLGKTYSNSVQVSVANYHDLKKVMDDKEHHYYIDHKDVGYEPKIYINDYKTDDPTTSQNGLDLFRDLIDLTYGTEVTGHTPLDLTNTNKPLRGGEYLEFFLRADQDHTGSEWTPIANGTNECFEGILHGDGHTITGLDHSLFQHLCGEVYNLGVTGSFTGAGIAEDGSGYVENCWVKTSAPNATDPDYEAGTSPAPLETGTGHYAVFANPTRPVYSVVHAGTTLTAGETYYTSNDGAGQFTAGENVVAGEDQYYKKNNSIIQVVNSYYPESNQYTVPASADHGVPTQKPDKSFYNGEVTYNLNGFYLYKRYNDNASAGGTTTYQYWKPGVTAPQTGTYAENTTLCSSGYNGLKYVEDRFKDGDFVYADGTIPGSPNKRLYVDPETKEEVGYFPIWPDDYLFFGQALNYSHMDGKNGLDLRTHQPLPSTINKSNDQVVTNNYGNRVYRAPAYFRSKVMGVAYFNPYAVFVDEEKLTDEQIADNVVAREAYKGMTAIDFTGYNDVFTLTDASKDAASNNRTTQLYQKGWDDSKKYFYQPLLDDDGLQDIYIAGITSNVLAYTTTGTTAANKTNQTVSGYMTDQAYSETNDEYRTVASFDAQAYNPGHWVQLTDAGYRASRDHLLYDKQDFNAPISYTYGSNNLMWYQRKPDNYVDRTKGWEAVSLPFSAELVTAHQKGEITHFYSGSAESKNGTGTKIGHEYWLREFDKTAGTLKEKTDVTGILEGNFNYPSGTDAESKADVLDEKDYLNTFLWDHYYKNVDRHNLKDLNEDTYQTYYASAHKYMLYPMLTKAIPYIIGFPGTTYYEFDLSGEFNPTTTAKDSPTLKLNKQTITFASQKGTTIGVSDDEMAGVENSVTISGTTTKYTFKPSYMNEAFEAGSDIYTLKSEFDSDGDTKADCSSFVKVPAAPGVGDDPVPDIEVAAFRPYFMSQVVTGARPTTRAIVFNNDDSQLKADDDHGNVDGDELGNLRIYAKKHKIVVESALTRDIDVRILTPAGVTLTTFTLEPGETIETRIVNAGVYIVQSADNRYIKKLVVK